MRPETNHASPQTKLWTHARFIKRYLRYTMIRCPAHTNDKACAQRIAFDALVTACLLGDELKEGRHMRHLIDRVVALVGNELLSARRPEAPVFALDDRMCEVAGAVNALPGPLREALVLYHIEGLDADTLVDALTIPAVLAMRTLTEVERQFATLLSHLSSHGDEERLDVHALLVEFAGCLDLPWAERAGGAVLQYLTAWDHPEADAQTPWTVN